MTSHKPLSSLILNGMILSFSMGLYGIIAVLIGRDLNFDLVNYHYSNAYLFLHHQLHQDFWPPSFFHRYLSPTADLFSYFLINYFSPNSATFIAGAIDGVNIWLLFQIARLYLDETSNHMVSAVIIAFIGIYGSTGFFGIGSFKNDHLTSLWMLLSVPNAWRRV